MESREDKIRGLFQELKKSAMEGRAGAMFIDEENFPVGESLELPLHNEKQLLVSGEPEIVDDFIKGLIRLDIPDGVQSYMKGDKRVALITLAQDSLDILACLDEDPDAPKGDGISWLRPRPWKPGGEDDRGWSSGNDDGWKPPPPGAWGPG
jgi:hypothetical protein